MRINILLVIAVFACASVCVAQSDERETRFTSEYTDLTSGKGCRQDITLKNATEGSDPPLICRGPGGYQVHIGYGAVSAFASVEMVNSKFKTTLAEQSAHFNEGRKIEWRLADGRPFAVIMRVVKYRKNVDDPNEAFSDKNKLGEMLIVRGLKGQEHIRFDVDLRQSENANEEARKLADAGFRRK